MVVSERLDLSNSVHVLQDIKANPAKIAPPDTLVRPKASTLAFADLATVLDIPLFAIRKQGFAL